MHPKLSVIIPNYNMASYLEEAINSVLAQSWTDYEIVVVNDGSTDDSLAVIKSLCETYSCIRLLDNEKNQGAIYSVNRGIQAAKGDFIYLLAADDKALDGHFFQMMVPPLLTDNSIPMTTSDHGMFLDGETIIHTHTVFPHLKKPTRLTGEVFTELCHTEKLNYWLFAMGTVFRKRLFEEYGYFSKTMPVLSDWYLIHLFALLEGCLYIPGTYVAWRHRGNNNLYHHMDKNEVPKLLSLIRKNPHYTARFNRSRLLGCYVRQSLPRLITRPALWMFILPFVARKLENMLGKSRV